MPITSKEAVVSKLEKHLGLSLHQLPNKRIMFRGALPGGGTVVVCTPESKLYAKGNGWIDLTTIQVALLDEATLAILAIRLSDDTTHFLNFNEVRPLLTSEAMKNNKREGDHWKLHIWPDHIKVLGNATTLRIMVNHLAHIIAPT